jgi:hypothetical protein
VSDQIPVTVTARIVRGATTNRVRVEAHRRRRMDDPTENEPEAPNAATAQAAAVSTHAERDDLEVAPDTLPYKVICISLYHADRDRLNAMVAELKRRGLRKANASWLIRRALAQLDLDTIVPPTTKEP